MESGHRILQATTFDPMLVPVGETERLEIVTHRTAGLLLVSTNLDDSQRVLEVSQPPLFSSRSQERGHSK
jgi:hypothetical protein